MLGFVESPRETFQEKEAWVSLAIPLGMDYEGRTDCICRKTSLFVYPLMSQSFMRTYSVSDNEDCWIKNNSPWDFPGGPVVKTQCFYCRGLRFHPWFRECLHMAKKNKKGKEDIISVSRNSGKNRTECIHDDKWEVHPVRSREAPDAVRAEGTTNHTEEERTIF